MMILMRFDSEMPMVEDVCLQRLDAGVGPTVGAAPVWVHLPWWQQQIHRFQFDKKMIFTCK